MKYKDWSGFKIYCSLISKLLTQPQGFTALSKSETKKYEYLSTMSVLTDKELTDFDFLKAKRENYLNPPVLSATAQSHLIEIYSKERYGIRRASSGGLAKSTVVKGFALEKEGIDLLSKIDGVEYVKQTETISDDYFIGQCDILCPISSKIIDIKTSWNAASFMKNKKEGFKLPIEVWAQVQGYLHLYKLQQGQACYVLVNTPPHLIEQEWSNLFKRYSYGEITREKYDENCYKLEVFFDYNKIPEKRRVIKFDIEYSPDFITKVKTKVDMSRSWLNDFEKRFFSNKPINTNAESYLHIPENKSVDSEGVIL